MIDALDNPILVTELDANGFNVLNCGIMHQADLLETDDPRLSDARDILDGSVTNDSVAWDAAIVQSKLNLNGDIPPNYLGTTDTSAAQGDLAQLLSEKDQVNGYAGLDGNTKLASGTVPLSGTGRVADIHLSMPLQEFGVTEGISGTDRSFTVFWNTQPPYSFLSDQGFVTAPFPDTQIPNLSSAKITTGQLEIERLPFAVGVGVNHAAGLVPAPGDSSGETGLATDYLARDMTYKRMVLPVAYQPQLPDPSVTVQAYFKEQVYITVTSGVEGATLFYALDEGVFTEISTLPLLLDIGVTIKTYAAKDGWSNSEIVAYKTEPPNMDVSITEALI